MAYKQFQKDAIAKILNGYETNKYNNRFLVADEVGLGKTFIAKGVIRCLAYFNYLEEKHNNDTRTNFDFKVLYLCSNLNIAEQNKRKLGISSGNNSDFFEKCISGEEEFKNYKAECDEDTGSSIENRTTMLIKQQLGRKVEGVEVSMFREECVEILGEKIIKDKEVGINKNENDKISLQIIPITPNTSIKIRYAGHIEERKFISDVFKIINNENISNYEKVSALKKNIVGKNSNDSYYSLKDGDDENIKILLADLLPALEELLSKEELNVKDLLDKKYKDLANKVDKEDDETWKSGWELLRKLFALSSLQLLKYDFVVLDEFQNFNDILQKANQTKLAKEQYRSQIEYIYSVLKTLEGVENDNIELENIKPILKSIENTFGDDASKVNISDYETNFWKNNLKSLEKKDWTIETITEHFLNLSKPGRGNEGNSENSNPGDTTKAGILKLVKAILNEKAEDRADIIKNAYIELNEVNSPLC